MTRQHIQNLAFLIGGFVQGIIGLLVYLNIEPIQLYEVYLMIAGIGSFFVLLMYILALFSKTPSMDNK
jgi:hypothetical protein